MVQLLADPTHSQSVTPAPEKQEADMSREEHAQKMRELSVKRGVMRAPRRGWSMTDYQANAAPATTHHQPHAAAAQVDRQATIPENAVVPPAAASKAVELPRRPRMPPPRRSYSVTDKEPEAVAPGQPRPSARMTILDLPSELHYALFDLLDPIDGVCLGLAHSRLYAMHRRKHGRVPLCSRYSGPNDREWAWRGAGPLLRPAPAPAPAPAAAAAAAAATGGGGEARGLDQLRVKGQVYCRKCGVSRCELHRHLRDWMGAGYEYCEIRRVYGRPAARDAKAYCFMSSPKNPHRCGRHGGPKAAP